MEPCREASIIGGDLFEQFVKIAGSALTRLLVKKGIFTEEEICKAFLHEIEITKGREI